jgi:hypothetical protein
VYGPSPFVLYTLEIDNWDAESRARGKIATCKVLAHQLLLPPNPFSLFQCLT